ncbi:MAG: Gfo/Idh/MocA family oxidoreductase [Planctomycetaceae bacterium]|nr:Gfo/Idh/MocA family oxidoreductase [Planctomycetaceae bacterium]
MSRTSSTRRDFLKHSAAAAGTLAALQASAVRYAHAAADSTCKIALIGCGGRGTGAVDNCLDAAKIVGQPMKLVAVADAFADRANNALKAIQEKWQDSVDVPAERIFTGLDGYQKAIDCGVDLVLMASPPGFRPMQYAAAVKAGKNVFMEKPLCTDAPGFRQLVEANELADKKGLKVVVGLQRHHQGPYIQGIQEIHDGKLGEIELLRIYWNGSGGGARDLGPRPQNDPEEMMFQIRNWGCFRWLYGDNIVEQHVHNIDIANWVMAKDGNPKNAHPVEANGMGGRVDRGNYGDIFDHHFVEFTYADGVKVFSQSRHQPGTWDQVDEFAHGTKGRRKVANGSGPKLESDNPYVQEHVDLMKAIAADTYLNEGWFGAVSSMTAVLGRMATYSGKVVKWDDAVAHGQQESPETIAWDATPRSLPDDKGFYPFPIPGISPPF